MKKQNLSVRRSVLTGVALSALSAAAVLVGCSKEQTDDPVVVSGGGSTGNAGTAGTAQGGSGGSTGGTGAGGAAGDSAGGAGGGNGCLITGQVRIPAGTGDCMCPPFSPDECAGACVNLQENAEYCGDCATACDPGSACSAGACTTAPTEVATLTGCTANATRMVLTGTTFYFSDSGTGTISSMPVAGGAATEIATAQMMPGAIAVDATSVYWSNMGDNTIMKAPLAGGAAETLITLDAPAAGLAVGNDMVFFTHGADAFMIPTSGAGADAGAGTPPSVLACSAADALEGKTPIDPPGDAVPGATFVASSNASCTAGGELAAIGLNGTELVYTVSIRQAVEQSSQSGGTYFELGQSQGSLLPDAIAMNATLAFWANGENLVAGTLSVDHTAAPVVTTPKFDAITGFTVTATHGYVAGMEGGIARRSLTEVDPAVKSESLALDQVDPKWLVNDGTNLYWIGSDCKIMTIPLPQ